MRAMLAKVIAPMPPSPPSFEVAARLTLPFHPSTAALEAEIDAITLWACSSDRKGYVRRKVCKITGDISFEFEQPVDAVECSLRFL